MTPLQKKLARHALGLPNERCHSYRNRYYAAEGTREYRTLMAMCRKGLADRATHKLGFGRPRFFWLTLAGAWAAIEHNETLDREDFPPRVDEPKKRKRAA